MLFQPLLQILRAAVEESVHYGAIAVADPNASLIAWWGEPEAVTYLRSAAKPLQALPLLESGAADRFRFTDREIALACASHSGLDEHMTAVAEMQAKIGVSEGDLLCGTHPPFDKPTAHRLQMTGESATPNRHNCSGKHTGMLATAKHLREPLENYIEPQHPVQRRILAAIAEMTDQEASEIPIGTDGCSAPIFALPLRAAAAAYARLSDPSGLPPARAEACRRIFKAMTTYPEMVSGPGSFDTRLMQATPGRLLAKGGAEGYQALALSQDAGPHSASALGIALKIADGDLGRRARPLLVLAVLEALGALSDGEIEALAEFGPRPVTNHRGLKVGEMRPCFELQWGSD